MEGGMMEEVEEVEEEEGEKGEEGEDDSWCFEEEVEKEMKEEVEEVEEGDDDSWCFEEDGEVEEVDEELEKAVEHAFHKRNFEEDFEKFETEMDVLCFIKEIIYHPTVISMKPSFYLEFGMKFQFEMEEDLNEVERLITTIPFRVQHVDIKLEIMEKMLLLACRAKDITKVRDSSSKSVNMRSKWRYFLRSLSSTMSGFQDLENCCEEQMQLMHKLINSTTNSLPDFKNLEMSFLDTEDCSKRIPQNLESQELLLIKAVPALVGFKESSDMVNLIIELYHELRTLPKKICRTCEENPESVLLIGGLLSFKRPDVKTWSRVHNDIWPHRNEDIISYCIKDLPHSIMQCYMYIACYPIGYDIPTALLTKIWIAEGFITPEKGETPEETANQYLEELVQRSFIWVSKRSLSGTIKLFRVSRAIHGYVIDDTRKNGFLVVNPDEDNMESLARVAIHNNDKNQCMEVKSVCIRSFLAFNIHRNVLITSPRFLRVLELRNSVVSETVLEKMPILRYLGLRGSKISKLPENIGNMKNLQTLDVRDTNIEILPESLWTISTLRHVYVNPGPRIQGPPSTVNIPNLQILKTVVVPESWLKQSPHLSINLTKLAISYVGHLELETISNPLSHLVNLLSITIMGPIVHGELADTRAFPNLNTLKAIKFVGIWKFRKLSIDNVEFPSNLAKLVLSNSRLKEDPMPRLERLQALKLLRLEDRAYTGEKMICSANRFPQLQTLKLSQLKNLKIWEVKPMAMSMLTTLCVVKCRGLEINLPDLEHVKDIVIDN